MHPAPLLALIACAGGITLSESWTFHFSDAPRDQVFDMLEAAFDLAPWNPDARCLHDHIEYHDETAWTRATAVDAIASVMANACCDVSFREGGYQLLPAARPNRACRAGRRNPAPPCERPTSGMGVSSTSQCDIDCNTGWVGVTRRYQIDCLD